MKKLFSITVVIITFITLPSIARAAVLYFDPDEITLGPGDNAEVNLMIDINSGCVNTIEGTIIFPQDYLQIVNFITGDSIISIWVDKPGNADLNRINQNGEFHFSGGIPGGYCGKIPGDPGESNIIGRFVFQMPSFIVSDRDLTKAAISFIEPTRALLNDGFGTEDKLLTRSIAVNFADRAINPNDDWRARIKDDKIPPEPFVVELHQRNDIFEGKYYIIFYTTDKQTGVDHYEVLEIREGEVIGETPEISFLDGLLEEKRGAPNWVVASMPYVLKDQNLLSIIKVRAIDKAGNERLVEYVPPQSLQKAPKDKSTKILYVAVGGAVGLIGIFLIILIFIILYKKFKRNNQHEEE